MPNAYRIAPRFVDPDQQSDHKSTSTTAISKVPPGRNAVSLFGPKGIRATRPDSTGIQPSWKTLKKDSGTTISDSS